MTTFLRDTGWTFRSFLQELPDLELHRWLAESPYEAGCLELPKLTVDRLDDPFECVLVQSPALARVHAQPEVFGEHFDGSHAVAFTNLRGDSDLIAPCPREGRPSPHLLAWTRHATEDEAVALWTLVAATLEDRVSNEPTWLSTAGMGVYWLHVRLDPTPKYYKHRPYRS